MKMNHHIKLTGRADYAALIAVLAGVVLLIGAARADEPMNAWHIPSNQEPSGHTMLEPSIVTDAVAGMIELFVGIYPQSTVYSGACHYREVGQASWLDSQLNWFVNQSNNEYWMAGIQQQYAPGTTIQYYFELEGAPGVYCTTYVCGGTSTIATCDEAVAQNQPFSFLVYHQAPTEITTDTSWSSPVYVSQTVSVRAGATLSIGPTASVSFAADCDLEIEGTLAAVGTWDHIIVFGSILPNPPPASWGSVKFLDSSIDAVIGPGGEFVSGCGLVFCEVRHGRPGIVCDESSPYILYSSIHDCQTVYGGGISCSGGAAVISNCVINNNKAGMGTTDAMGGGIYLSNTAVTINSCSVANNDCETGGSGVWSRGGGICIDGGTAAILHSTISGNTVMHDYGVGQGGGVWATGNGIVIDDCVIENNGAYGYHGTGSGGGVWITGNSLVHNCALTGNTSGAGGGAEIGLSAVVEDSNIEANTATGGYIGRGGGVDLAGGAVRDSQIWNNFGLFGIAAGSYTTGLIHGCWIHDNQTGSAVATQTGTTSVTIEDTIINANAGPAVRLSTGSALITNTLIYGNSAQDGMGGVGGLGDATAINCTIADNEGFGFVASGTVSVVNCILYGNDDDIVNSYPDVAVQYSDIGDGDYQGSHGNISCPPQFIDPGTGNYHIAGTSCCRDAGTCDGAPREDYDGEPRPDPDSGLCDIGFDEVQGPPVPTPTPTATGAETVTASPTIPATPTPTVTVPATQPPTASPTATTGPSATHTPPSATTTPTRTMSPTPAATATPTPGTALVLAMPAHEFHEGDSCWLSAIISHHGPTLSQVALVVVLDAGGGTYYFWPSWKAYPPDLDYSPIDVSEGEQSHGIIASFEWPVVDGSAAGLYFYGAVLDEQLSQLISNLDEWEFGYGP